MFTDVVGSVELKTRFGTPVYSSLIRRHDELFRMALLELGGPDAAVRQDTGDGHYASFPTVSAAVRCALRFQHDLSSEHWSPAPLKVRIGIYLGEMAEVRPDDSPDGAKLAGLAVDLAARVMSLAVGGQILLTRFAFNDARQFVPEHPSSTPTHPLPPLKWVAHGPYLFKGMDEPVEVFEVGTDGSSPPDAPKSSEKAKRVVPNELEETLGWRPALGLEIPGRTGWSIMKKLGEGGFGEVWLGEHLKLHDQRVFKFCFDPDRLRSFKREMTLFRLLRDALGDRPDIAQLHEVKLDESPFFLESEYTEGGNLADWAFEQGGIRSIAIKVRLDLVARIADAVTAAHSVGILHKDIKPSNVLIFEDAVSREPRPRLSDFGIGMLSDRSQLVARNITETGFTLITQNDSSRTGTRLYAPPEILAGRQFTVQGDVYALGILLYQMVIGDFSRPLAVGWERDITDTLLRQDIAIAVEGDASLRLPTAARLPVKARLPRPFAADCRPRLAAASGPGGLVRQLMTHTLRSILCLGLLLCVAARRAEVSATLTPADLPAAGGTSTLDVTIRVPDGLHAQSHTPQDPSLIPLVIKFDPPVVGVAIGTPQYPPGTDKVFAAMGSANVYTGTIHVLVPVTVSAKASTSTIKITGRVSLQACDDNSCYPPDRVPFQAVLNVAGGEPNTAVTRPTTAASPLTTTSPAAPEAPPAAVTLLGLNLGHDAYAVAFGGAFVVGLVFNLMPCVLPVIPLKVLGFYQAAGQDRAKSIMLGAAFSVGLIASFAVLAVLVVGLRVIDWGGLFRHTGFTLAITTVLLVMALNLLGLFTVNLPPAAYRFAPRHDTLLGNAMFGVLTAALSTPCTFGMFVVLLTWALSQPPAIGVALIMTVGAGMASPYLLLSATPELARRFPRTGPLGELVRQTMGFLVLAIAVYFAWPLLGRHASASVIWWVLFGIVAVAAVFATARSIRLAKRVWPKVLTGAVAVAVVIAAGAATARLAGRPFEWQPYSDSALTTAAATGRPVLVDFTATWCGNCHYIEGKVLNDPRVVRAVLDGRVVMLKADVTDADAPGQRLLARLSPAGAIPLTAVYLPSVSRPRLLGGIYGVDELLSILQARGVAPANKEGTVLSQ